MMWPRRWDGQKQATNFGQTSGQRQTRHTQNEKMLDMKYASLASIQVHLHWSSKRRKTLLIDVCRSLKVMTCVVSVSGDDYVSFQCCTLDSWSTGVLLQAKNWERSMILAMKRWLLFIQQWHKNKKAFLTNINRYMIYPLANKTFYLVSLKRLVKKSTYSLSSWSLMMRSRGGLMMFEGQVRKNKKGHQLYAVGHQHTENRNTFKYCPPVRRSISPSCR